MTETAHPYVVEEFTPDERAVLERYFSNVDRPVFVLRNLPEAVKGALFARYSRTQKSLRRLFLDEFYRGEQLPEAEAAGTAKAEELYERIFIEFGDDSVAQLGGAHIAVEQASNILTKAIEWGRLAAYLEQSTRYVGYDDKPGGRWRYYLEPDVMSSPLAAEYEKTLDGIFQSYASSVPKAIEYFRERFPQQPGDPDRVYRSTIKAKALDTLRGMLPAATVSNLGVYASGQAFENMILRMRASPLAEVRAVADMMLRELNEVIPIFLQRLEQPQRGGIWTEYLRATRDGFEASAHDVVAGEKPEPRPGVVLTEWDPDAELRLVAAMLYSSTHVPEDQLLERARSLSADERMRLVREYVGERGNRRHKPGRALERVTYRFDILSDYGAFRDIQRHRMMTIEWQDLTTLHGYEIPSDVAEAGLHDAFTHAMDESARLWERIAVEAPKQAQYAVCMAYRIRYVLQLNAREALHLIELRSSPQGHPAYRSIAHEMHRQIAEIAGHKTVAEMMRFVDYSDVDLERLDAERRAEAKRQRSAALREGAQGSSP